MSATGHEHPKQQVRNIITGKLKFCSRQHGNCRIHVGMIPVRLEIVISSWELFMRWIILSATHVAVLAVGFALGVYTLPILTAPESLDREMLATTAKSAIFKASFTRDLKGSDFLHWGEGSVSLTPGKIVHEGELAPGPDYKLYLVKQFVEDEAQFLKVKPDAQLIGDVKTFDGFLLDVPQGVDIGSYSTVVVWCEAFGEFITAAKYQ